MTVFYRLCDFASTNPSPVFQGDKPRLNKLCLKSFLKAFEDVKYNLVVLADYCRPDTIEMVRKLVPDAEVLETAIGINESCLMQYMMANELDDDIFLFQECDYIYIPGTGKKLVGAIKQLGLVSPYDHLNFYMDRELHSTRADIFLIDNHHFRTVERNTMTFGIKADLFKENLDLFMKYGYLDGDIWYDLLSRNVPLFTPLPSFATHMVQDYLAPGIDWEEQWKKNI